MSTELTDPPERLPEPRSGDTMTISSGTRLCRIYNRRGPHATRPDQLRHWGPAPMARFDHHDHPVGDHLDAQGDVAAATGYYAIEPPPKPPPRDQVLAVDSPVVTAAAEAFQSDRIIDCSDRLGLAIMSTRSDIEVLDLSSGWPTRSGAGSHLATGPRSQTQTWARAIHAAHPQLAGIAWTSSVHPPGRVAVLNERAADRHGIVATRLHFDRALDDDVSSRIMRLVSDLIGYEIV